MTSDIASGLASEASLELFASFLLAGPLGGSAEAVLDSRDPGVLVESLISPSSTSPELGILFLGLMVSADLKEEATYAAVVERNSAAFGSRRDF